MTRAPTLPISGSMNRIMEKVLIYVLEAKTVAWGRGPRNRSSILGGKIVLPFTESSRPVLGST